VHEAKIYMSVSGVAGVDRFGFWFDFFLPFGFWTHDVDGCSIYLGFEV